MYVGLYGHGELLVHLRMVGISCIDQFETILFSFALNLCVQYRIFSKNLSHLVSQKFCLTTEFRVVLPPLRMADETLESSNEYFEN